MEFRKVTNKKNTNIIILSALFTVTTLVLGYIALGIWPAFIFTFGFAGGFVLWLFMPMKTSFKQISVVYFLTLALFMVHKIEERKQDFFPALSKITGVPVPEASSLPAILLYVDASFWLLIPFFILKRLHLAIILHGLFLPQWEL